MSDQNITVSDLDGLGLEDFDPAEYLTSEEAAAVYINEALATGDAAFLASAIGDIARARGMTEIAKSAGITREALYKALRQNSQPRMETIARVLGAMQLRLVVEPIPAELTKAEATQQIDSRKVEVRHLSPTARKAPPKRAPVHSMPAAKAMTVEATPANAPAKSAAKKTPHAPAKKGGAKKAPTPAQHPHKAYGKA
ncbi:addiction module antidote protein [Pseudoduganella sp. R-34]|uniref:addiction module antidote protein n=1 Tax=unclassified Pseudoduganella TaxID=2637179 RepID=UPI003CEBD00D